MLVAVLMTQLLASRARWLGPISYSTYLYHEMAAGSASDHCRDRCDVCRRKHLLLRS